MVSLTTRLWRFTAAHYTTFLIGLALAGATLSITACATGPEFDVVIAGGSLIDGTGAAPRREDIGIKGDRIAAIGNLANHGASVRIDATGKTVAPGLVDVMGRSGMSLLANGLAESHLRQGITTELLGDHSPAFWTDATADHNSLRAAGVTVGWNRVEEYFKSLTLRGVAINVGTLAPLSIASSDAAAFVNNAIRDGAWGVVDDVGVSAADASSVAALVGQADGVLLLPANSPVAASDESFYGIGRLAHRIVITDLSRVAPDAAAELNGRIARATERNIAVYGTIVPPPEPLIGLPVPDALRYGGVMVATNSSGITITRTSAAAATFTVFPQLLGPWVRDEHVMELREAIRRSTSLPAAVFKLPQRGIIRENYFADIIVFDAATIGGRSTLQPPALYPAGIDYVLVNGVVTVTPRGTTGARPGYALLRNRFQR